LFAARVRVLVSPPLRSPAEFQPLHPASRAHRLALVMLGPVTWVVALVVLAFVLDHRDAVEYALTVLFVSFAVGLVLLGSTRFARAREERDP
jgi:hypothetical protein